MMKNANCAIIEDEPIGAKTLQSLIKAYRPEFRVDTFARTLAEAKNVLSNTQIDLVFCDIELLDGNVFEILDDIDFSGKHIIFTTAYEEFGAKAFKYPALHYLMKPINPLELEKALERFNDITEKNGTDLKDKNDTSLEYDLKKMLLPTQNGMIFLDYDMVVRIQSSNKYSIVFTVDKKQLIVSKPLSRFEEVVAKKGFLRIHDSHIINLTHVKSYLKGKGGEIVMSDGSHVPISIRKKEVLATIFKDMI